MQPSTEVSSEKNEDMEILSKLKSEGALENYNHEDFKSKSELEPEVEAREEGSGESDNHLAEKPEEIMDVKDENKDGKGESVLSMFNMLISSSTYVDSVPNSFI